MPKSNHEPERVDAYAAGLEPHARHIFDQVRAAIHAVAPDVTETIKYDMPQFTYAGTYLYVGAWKKHIGLYPIYPAAPELEAEIASYRAAKDTVQFKYAKPVPFDLIERIARARISTTAGSQA